MNGKSLFVAGILLMGALGASADSYTVTWLAGSHLIANQLDNPGGNNINNILALPYGQAGDYDGASYTMFSTALQTTGGSASFDSFSQTWDNPLTLNPGEGATLWLPVDLTWTFTGALHTSAPIPPQMNRYQMVSDRLPEPGNWQSIFPGTPPGLGTKVFRMDIQGNYSLETDYTTTGWNNGAPTANVGEAWMVYYVPEPSCFGLLGLGFAGLMICRRRK